MTQFFAASKYSSYFIRVGPTFDVYLPHVACYIIAYFSVGTCVISCQMFDKSECPLDKVYY